MLLENIAGNTTAKRAIEIAAAGAHSILLIGPRGTGKGLLVAAFHELMRASDTLQMQIPHGPLIAKTLPCFCGEDNISRPCECSPRAKQRYARRLRAIVHETDILVEVLPVPTHEQLAPSNGRGTTKEAVTRIVLSRTPQVVCNEVGQLNGTNENLNGLVQGIDAAGRRILELAARRLTFSTSDTLRVLRVARTIADLAGDTGIPSRAVAEAIQYRYLLTR